MTSRNVRSSSSSSLTQQREFTDGSSQQQHHHHNTTPPPPPLHHNNSQQKQSGNPVTSMATATTTTTMLFDLVNVHGRITLDNVYQNGLHALKRLEIRNLTDQRILVKMRSNLRHQIAFQLNNENINSVPDHVLEGIATNTVDWSHTSADTFHFNQLFNYVNHIDQLELEPHQTLPLILAFLPESRHLNRSGSSSGGGGGGGGSGSGSGSGSGGGAANGGSGGDEDTETNEAVSPTGFTIPDPADEDNMYETFNVTGSLFFFGYYLQTDHDSSSSSSSTAAASTTLIEHNQQDAMVTTTLADYQSSIKFRASVCRSVMWTDVVETGLNFEDCMLGQEYHKDFTIQNNSDIDLYWLLNTVDLSNLNREEWLRFSDAETGKPLSNGDDQPAIPGHSHRRIRLTFMPKEVGEFSYDLQIENANDARNVVQTKVHAVVRSVLREESLVISSGNSLDFADCVSGQWTSRQIVLNNVGESSVEVRFIPESADMVFDIKAALDQDNNSNSKPSRPALERASTSGLSVTPTTTMTATSEVSAHTASEVSSRASSPASSSMAHLSRAAEHNGGSQSPSSQDSYRTAGARIQTPSLRSLPGDSDQVAVSRIMEDGDGTSTTTTPNDRPSTPGASSALTSAGSYTRIEDLVLRPGKERVIQVSYRPKKDASINDFNAGQLIRRNFRIVLEYGTYRSAEPKERKVIQCRARTCTSFVEVIPKEINFGDTDVGTLKSLPINIFNRADIVARVELQFSSKVLNCLRGEIVIQPRSYVELKLDLYPRKVNPEYRKQITLVNYLNRDNDQIIGVRSTNIDKNRVTFHSLFYRILTTTGANFLDFGSTVLNSPAIRTFTVENIRSAPLRLEVTTSLPDDILVYTKKRRSDRDEQTSLPEKRKSPAPRKKSPETLSRKHAQKDVIQSSRATGKTLSLGDKMTFSPMHRLRHSPVSNADARSTAYLDLATSRHNVPSRRKHVVFQHPNKNALVQAPHHMKRSPSGSANASPVERQRPDESARTNNKKSPPDGSPSSQSDSKKPNRSLGITAARYKSRKNLDWSDIAGKSRVPFEDLISVLEHGSKAPTPLFPKQSAEERFVRQQLAWRRELDRLIEKGDLVRTQFVDVLPHAEEEVVIVYTPNGSNKPHIQSAPKKQDGRIFLRLVDFDRNIEQPEFQSLLYGDQSLIPVREVILRAQLCRSIMDLGQKNINFGLVERNERHAKSIVLHNRSETPLLYAIRKSGSIASGDIILGAGRYGVVRAFGKREIDFVFEPTLAGPFVERLVVENIRDRTNDRVLLLKALVRKPSTFFIKSLELAFGPCLVDQTCTRVETIVFTNTNKQSRLFEIRVDPNDANFGEYYGEFDFVVEDDDSNKALSKEAEEEIENLEQKLKIAKRKGQPDKVKKYLKKLAKLRNVDIKEDEDQPPVIESSQGDESSSPSQQQQQQQANGAEDGSKATEDKINGNGAAAAAAGEEGVKESNIYKKTPESVVFPLDPNATKTISVYFKAVARPVQAGIVSIERQQPIKGQILAHEYKNTDACKKIDYTAVLCKDLEAYNEALEHESRDTTTNSAKMKESRTESHHPPPQPASSSSAAAATATTPSEPNGDTAAALPDVDEQPEPLKLERSYFDGGRVEVNQKSTFYVRVSNESDEPVDYEVLLPPEEKEFFSCPQTAEPLAPRETRKLMFEILPTKVGKQQHTFNLYNRRTDVSQTFTLQCLVHYKAYLSFPSLSEDNQGELDLGFSYVDPGSKYSQVTPLLVENISGQDLYISSQSNLSHQVLIFVDETGERGLVDMMPFKAGSMTTVWVAVQPNLLTGYLGSSGDECRELVGGIKFSIYTQQAQDEEEEEMTKEETTTTTSEEGSDNSMVLMLTQTVKFVSIIGQSHLEVSHRMINLGYTDKLNEEFYGSFTIKNKSGQLPLDYEVECPSGNILLDRRGGTLNGWRGSIAKASRRPSLDYYGKNKEEDEEEGNVQVQRRDSNDIVPAMSAAQITFRICAYRYGLLSEKLVVTNKHNSQEVFEIEVRFFVNHKKLGLWNKGGAQLMLQHTEDHEHVDHREADPLPVVEWESIYVSPAAHQQEARNNAPVLQVIGLPDNDEARLHVRELEVANTSNEAMQLIAMSDIDITAGWVADEDQVKTAYVAKDKDTAYLQRSGQLVLDPGQRVGIRLQCPSAEKLSEQDRIRASQGKSGVLKGMFILYDMREQVEVMAMELRAVFCVSLGELVVDRIDLGQMGHTASWKPVNFNFTVRNLADVPLNYEVQRPEFMSFSPLNATVPAGKNLVVAGILDPRQLHDQSSGQRRFDVRIANHYNRNNTMHLRLKAFMTVFELCFERLNDDVLELPALYHPMSANNIPCDNWFVIHNTTDDDIRFEIGADIAPDLAEFFNLDVLSRYTNTPLKGGIAISPQGQMEVRVRATPNECSRLPKNRPDLLNPEGITLAELWVTTRPINAEEDRKLRETIPVHSVLVETPTFSLVERRLDFELVTYYQEEDKNEEDGVMDAICRPESCPFTIINHATKLPLRFKVIVEGPDAFPAYHMVDITPLAQDGTGIVEPDSTLTLNVRIANPKDCIPGQIRIYVEDLDAVGQIRQTASMFVKETVWDL